MAKETKQVKEEKETKEYEVKELVEGIRTYFVYGLVTDEKNGKKVPRYLRKVTGEDGKATDESIIFTTLYLAGNEERNEKPNFKNFAVQVALAKKVKEAGIDLKVKGKTPIKVRYTITETYNENKGNQFLRQLTNVAIKNGDNWEWVIKPKKKDDNSGKEVVNDDDLPW